MKNSRFAKIFAIISGAALISVVLIGISTASGTAPSVAPPGDGVVPTFAGLNVDGNINFSNGTVFLNELPNNLVIGDSSLVVDSGDLLIGDGDLDLIGDMVVRSGTDASPNGSSAFKITNAGRSVIIDTNEIMSIGGKLYLNHDSDQDVQIGNNAHPSNLEVNGETRINNFLRAEGLQVTGHSVLDSIASNRIAARDDLYSNTSLTSQGTSNLIGPTTIWDLEVPFGASINVEGNINLPFEYVSSNFSFSSRGSHASPIPAVCPAGSKVVACHVKFNLGKNYVMGSGVSYDEDSCVGTYYHTTQGRRVTGTVKATCL